MTETDPGPILNDWIIEPQETVTARELATVIGGLDLDDLRPWHPEIVLALAELARSAHRDWPWGHDDPLVALLRAAAKLSLDTPQATSEAAARLVTALSQQVDLGDLEP